MNEKDPIFITALPRSRTAWIAAYFGFFHDLTERNSIETICEKVKGRGLADSGLLFHYHEIAERFPNAKWVFIERDPQRCFASLNELKIFGDIQKPFELCLEKVAQFKREMNCKTVAFDKLDYPSEIRDLHAYLDIPFDYEKHAIFKELKITSLLWQ